MKIWISIAGLFGLQAVVSASFSAHGGLADWEKDLVNQAVDFQLIHTLVILGLGLAPLKSKKIAMVTNGLFFLGVILFCGQLYLRGFTTYSLFSHAAPLGGTAFILGWLGVIFLGIKEFFLSRKP